MPQMQGQRSTETAETSRRTAHACKGMCETMIHTQHKRTNDIHVKDQLILNKCILNLILYTGNPARGKQVKSIQADQT